MSKKRFWSLWSNLHVVEDAKVSPSYGIGRKLVPLLDVLSQTFFHNYSPGQELVVDEAMVKYKGRAKGKVKMPKKPIKNGFKIWCCCCSCCGYLCSFRLYSGKPVDPSTGKRVRDKGMVKRVVKDLANPFEGMNHVLYMDNFFTSGPLVDELAALKIYVVGTIQQRATGFPNSLKGIKIPKGSYLAQKVGGTCYYVFHDRKVVSFVSNVFPEAMDPVAWLPIGSRTFQSQLIPPVVPPYNKYMGAVDRLSQVRRTYGYDRKCKRYWFRLFFQFLDYAVDNAHILYMHNCRQFKMKPMSLYSFRLNLVEILNKYRKQPVPRPCASIVVGCSLKRVSDIGLKRGRCQHCVLVKKSPIHHTNFGCSQCRVRLCKIPCFAEFHQDS